MTHLSQQPQQTPIEKEIAGLKDRLDEHDIAIQTLSNYVDAQLAKGDNVETRLDNLTRQVQDIALGTVTPRNTMSYRTALANGPKIANKKTDPEWNIATIRDEKATKNIIATMDDFALNSGKVGDKAVIKKKCGVARKSTEISTIPRTWWEEDEKWAESHEIDDRGIIIKMVTQ